MNGSDKTTAGTQVEASCRSASFQDLNCWPGDLCLSSGLIPGSELLSAWRPVSLVHLASREVIPGVTQRQSWSLPDDSFFPWLPADFTAYLKADSSIPEMNPEAVRQTFCSGLERTKHRLDHDTGGDGVGRWPALGLALGSFLSRGLPLRWSFSVSARGAPAALLGQGHSRVQEGQMTGSRWPSDLTLLPLQLPECTLGTLGKRVHGATLFSCLSFGIRTHID